MIVVKFRDQSKDKITPGGDPIVLYWVRRAEMALTRLDECRAESAYFCSQTPRLTA